MNRPSADVESVMSNVRLFVVVVVVASSSIDDWTTERGDPQGRMSERGWVVDNETVALDEWLIVIMLMNVLTHVVVMARGY